MYQDFAKYGRELILQGLNHSHSGNISVCQGTNIFITGHGSQKWSLEYDDIVRANLQDTKRDQGTSIEIKLHRAIYQRTSYRAIIHAHPPTAIALSLVMDEIVPIDSEGLYYFPSIPVVSAYGMVGNGGMTEQVPQIIEKFPVVVIKGHGSVAAGRTLEEAFQRTSVLESICRIIHLHRTLK